MKERYAPGEQSLEHLRPVFEYLEKALDTVAGIIEGAPEDEDLEREKEDEVQIHIAIADLKAGRADTALHLLREMRKRFLEEGADRDDPRLQRLEGILAILEFEPN